MANEKIIKTRIQLKNDTESNWNKAVNFIPLKGEIIIYSADESHPFSRLKVGDGDTTVTALPFIDSGTLNGNETEIVKKPTFSAFPSPGSEDKLYIDLSTKKIYHYAMSSGYTELLNFSFSVQRSTISTVRSWKPGSITVAKTEDNIFKITNGEIPELLLNNISVVTNVTRE